MPNCTSRNGKCQNDNIVEIFIKNQEPSKYMVRKKKSRKERFLDMGEEKFVENFFPVLIKIHKGCETGHKIAEQLKKDKANGKPITFCSEGYVSEILNHFKGPKLRYVHRNQIKRNQGNPYEWILTEKGENEVRKRLKEIEKKKIGELENLPQSECAECGILVNENVCPSCGVGFEEEHEEGTEGQAIAEGEGTEEEEGEIEDKKPKIDIDAGFKRLNSKLFPHRDTNTSYPLYLEQYVVKLDNIGNSKAVSVKLFCEYKDSSNIPLPIDEIDIGILNTKNSTIKIFFFPVSRRSIFRPGKLILTVRYEHKTTGRKYESKREFDIITNSDAALTLGQDFSYDNILQPMGRTQIFSDSLLERKKD